MLIRIGIILMVLGGILAFLGIQEWFAFRTASARPEEITLRQLIARGPEGNAHIILKDFEVCDGDFVYETEGTSKSWNKVWVPVVPRDGPAHQPGQPGIKRPQQIQALIFSIQVRNKADLDRRCDVPRLQALVTNKLFGLGSEERRLLEQSYPGTDFSRCLIIQEGREPPGPVKMFVMVGGGGALLLIGGVLLAIPLLGGLMGSSSQVVPRKRRRQPREDEEDEDEEEEEEPRPRRSRRTEDDDEEPLRPRRRRPPEDE